jgi:hypothetical protein
MQEAWLKSPHKQEDIYISPFSYEEISVFDGKQKRLINKVSKIDIIPYV